jgi:general stress protein 26
MKTQPQPNDDMEHLASKLKGQRVAMLTLLESRSDLRSRPMTPLEIDEQGALWFISSRKTMGKHFDGASGHAARVSANLAFMREGDYISVHGHAELDDSPERKTALWTAAARPWFSGPDDPDLVLLKVVPAGAEIWDGPDNAVVRAIGMAASVLTGREIGLGHKDVITVGQPA